MEDRILVARQAPAYLPSGYKTRTNTVVKGVAKTGEVSPRGTVAETEDWEGRVKGAAMPATMRFVRDPDGRLRKMTLQEMIDRGLFFVGKGPA